MHLRILARLESRAGRLAIVSEHRSVLLVGRVGVLRFGESVECLAMTVPELLQNVLLYVSERSLLICTGERSFCQATGCQRKLLQYRMGV